MVFPCGRSQLHHRPGACHEKALQLFGRANLWVALVGLPSTGKTPGMRTVVEATRIIEREQEPDWIEKSTLAGERPPLQQRRRHRLNFSRTKPERD